jgi:outer membrane protein assembly factor BamD (BamD/ComL family)
MSFAILLALAALVPSPGPRYALAPPPEAPSTFALDSEEQKAREDERREREDERKAREDERKGREDELYDEGTAALDEGSWERAVSSFREVAEMKGRRADGALYWTAYAKAKQGQSAEALATVGELRKAYPQSRWLKEAGALEVEIRQRAGQPTRPESVADEDLKLMALNGLMNSDPEQAIPLLEKFLQGHSSRKLQERALFVLCQSGSPKAREIVTRIARGESQPDLQRKAIQSLGVFGSHESRQVLADVYASTSDPSVKKSVLQAFMVGGEKDRLLAAARGEKDPEVRRQAVRLLGAMGARSELLAMYQSETDPEAKKTVLQSLGVAGDSERLVEIARGDKDPEMRIAALKLLGPFGGSSKGPAIVEIYKAGDARTKEAALSALFVSGNAQAIIDIARSEKDPELKKKAVSHLSNMGSKEGTAYLLEILNK